VFPVLDAYGLVFVYPLFNDFPNGVRPGQRWRWIMFVKCWRLGRVQRKVDARVRAFLLRLELALSHKAHRCRLNAWRKAVPVVIGGQVGSVTVCRIAIKPNIIR
jgi:hypothetical protein